MPEPHGLGAGTVWAWPSFLDDGDVTDEECRATTVPPVMALQGHSAPLGITFYRWKAPEELAEECPPGAAFPREMDGYAFIAYHGSWNRDVPTGYKVVYVEMDENGEPTNSEPRDLLMHQPPNAQWNSGFRPVDVDFDECGRLLVSSDGSNSRGSGIVRLEYAGGTLAPTGTISPTVMATFGASTEGLYPLESGEPVEVTQGENATATTAGGDDVKNDPAGTSTTDTASSFAATGSQPESSGSRTNPAMLRWNLTGLVLAGVIWAALV